MIRTVEFRNFKALRHVKLDLERFTVIVGPNASGKTSIFEGLYYATIEKHSQVLAPFDLLHLLPRGEFTAAEVILETTEGSRKMEFSPPVSPPYQEGRSYEVSTGCRFERFNSRNPQGQWTFEPSIPPLATVSFLRLEAKQLAEPSLSQKEKPQVGLNGQGLASALAYLSLNRPTEFHRLLELLRLVFPFVEGIRFNRAPLQNLWGEALVLDLQGAPDTPAGMISDGTLFVLGILAAILGPDSPKLILLDDLDHGLHPRAQRDLVALLRKLLDQDPELQIVATTHSPYLLDQLEPKEVRLTTRLDDGSVACARLDEHPDFEKWKEAMTPGEFWSMVGEKWVGERQLEAAGS